MKLYVIIPVLLIISLYSFPAGKTEEADFVDTQGTEHWSYEWDVSDLEPGKYNLLIRGTDTAGNTFYHEPINIRLDPNSDLPEAAVSNPKPMARLGESAAILGTADDDDGIAKVEYRIDEGEYLPVEGTEFWSLQLDTGKLPEGYHDLEVRAVDTNGTVGPAVKQKFIVDTRRPTGTMESHTSDVLLSGKAVFHGLVKDENNITSVKVSKDGGESFTEIKTSRMEEGCTFRLSVNTKKLEDGPHVYWFENTDGAGNSSVWAFLFFVDNSPPELEVLYPYPEREVNGKFLLIGSADDKLGIKQLSYEAGESSGDADIFPGDPYWSIPFDFSTLTARKKTILLTLEDNAGNVIHKRVSVRLNNHEDKPVVTALTVLNDLNIPNSVSLLGFIEDDDGVKGIELSVNGDDPAFYSTGNAFSVDLTDLKPGNSDIRIRGVDIHGKKGDFSRIKTVIKAPQPEIKDLILSVREETVPYIPGMTVKPGEKPVLSGTVTGKDEINRLHFAVHEVSGTIKVKEGSFFIPLYKYIDHGPVPLTISRELYGSIFEKRLFFQGESEEKNSVARETQLYSPEVNKAGVFITEPDEPLFIYSSALHESTVFRSPLPDSELSIRNNTAVLVPSRTGVYPNTQFPGPLRSFDSIDIIVDKDAPVINLETPQNGDWLGDSIKIKGSVTDDTKVLSLSYRLSANFPEKNMKEQAEFKEVSADVFANGYFDFNISAPLDDGSVFLQLYAVDISGKETRKTLVCGKDTENPVIDLITPKTEDAVNGKTTFTAVASDRFGISRIRGGGEGSELREFNAGFFSERVTLPLIDTETMPLNLVLEADDRRGNTGTIYPAIILNSDEDIPQVVIHVPEEDGVVRTDFTINGIVLDDDGIAVVRYRIDKGDWIYLDSGPTFSIPQLITDYSDGVHTIEMTVTDTGGLESPPVRRSFSVSKTEPVSQLHTPFINETVKEEVLLQGSSSDPNGIESVWISLDNGNTFGKADGKEEWSYPFTTNILKDGTHSVYIKTFDNAQTKSLCSGLITVDNTKPELILNAPDDGASFKDFISLNGYVKDNIQLESMMISVYAYEDPENPIKQINITEEGVFSDTISIEGLSSGGYILSAAAKDKAGNTVSCTRSIFLEKQNRERTLKLLSPVPGESIHGDIVIEGQAENYRAGELLTIKVNGTETANAEIDRNGFFREIIPRNSLSDGDHVIEISSSAENPEDKVMCTVEYINRGGWVVIDSPNIGSFVSKRPYLYGSAGFQGNKDEENIPRLQKLAVSLDGGKSFEPIAPRDAWKYRIEPGELPAGKISIVVRAVFSDASEAYARTMLFIDTVGPSIAVKHPGEGFLFNDNLRVEGSAFDPNGLKNVQVNLRRGDKSAYEVPSFIQGLYLDTHLLGADFWEVGAGLSFFDDNVKLQAQIGAAPVGRFSGLVLGAKLLANIVQIPFSYFFGPDWSFFSMSLSVGANFSYFTMSDDEIKFTDEGLVLGALIGQYEFAKFDIAKWKAFMSYSFYTEGQLWFVSSDIQGGLVPRIAFGMRIRFL